MLEQYSLIKTIHVFLSNPHKAYSLRGLAAAAKVSKGAAAEAVLFMKPRGMLSFASIGNTHQYKADIENALCRQWKVLFNLEELSQGKLVGEVLGKIEGVECILLYGSLAKGTNDEKSDADVLVIARTQVGKKPALGGALKREPNLMVLSMPQWRQLSKKDKVFYESVITDSIALYGRKPVIA